MKLMNNKGFVRKILTVLLVIMLFNFTIPIQSQADDFGGKIFKPIFQLLAAVADIPIGVLHHTLLDTDALYDSVKLDEADEYNVKNGIWAYDGSDFETRKKDGKSITKELGYGNTKGEDGTLDSAWLWTSEINIPNILICPEYIFANRIAALDANFINPGSYSGGDATSNVESTALKLSSTVSTWYKAFRNVAIVAMLSILVYIGIRIIIGSTAEDKAKFKERLKDWLVAMCLLFAMHYIMAGVMLMSEVVTSGLSKSMDDNMIYVHVKNRDEIGNNGYFKTNYMGYIRLLVQSKNGGDAMAYLIMYIALVIYTIMFTIMYIKRLLFMAFFTMISPFVAMTYPLDKLADGSAQGFNTWFREYMFNALIQPIHLVIYTIIMGSVMALAVNNPIYGIVALGFILPAEKFIKKMFRFDKAQSSSTLGTVAGGALAMKGLQSVGKMTRTIGSGKGGNEKIRTKDSPELIGDKREKDKGIEDPVNILGAESIAGAESLATNHDLKGFKAYKGQIGNLNNKPDIKQSKYEKDKLAQLSKLRFNKNNINSNNKDNEIKEHNSSKLVKPRMRDRIKNTAGVIHGKNMRRLSLQRIGSNLAGTAIKGVKKLPRAGIHFGARAVGIGTLGALAASAAVTTGDAKTAASMIGTGVMLGNSIGGAVGGRISDNAQNSMKELRETISESWNYSDYDKQEIDKKQKEKYDKQWKQREDNFKYLRNKGLNNKDAEDFLNNKTQDFLNAGITDINLIYNARKMMNESKGKINIKGAVARAQLAKNVSDDFKNSTSEKNAFAERMQRQNKNIDTEKLIKEIIKLKKKDW